MTRSLDNSLKVRIKNAEGPSQTSQDVKKILRTDQLPKEAETSRDAWSKTLQANESLERALSTFASYTVGLGFPAFTHDGVGVGDAVFFVSFLLL